MESNFKLGGSDALMKALKELPNDLKRKVFKSFLSKIGRKFIVNELKQKLPYSSRLKKSIGLSFPKKDDLAVQVGVMTGQRTYLANGKSTPPSGIILKWLDKGTKPRKKGHNRGQITGQNRVQPIIESQIEPLIKYAGEEMANEINNNLKKRLTKLKKSL